MLEETQYYPFGLTMAGISSRALSNVSVNRMKFNAGSELQSEEFSDGIGLNWYDVQARTYDPQIGRFMQVDPETDEADQESYSSYHYCFNNPILHNDPDGKNPWTILRSVYGAVRILAYLERRYANNVPSSSLTRVIRDNTSLIQQLAPPSLVASGNSNTANVEMLIRSLNPSIAFPQQVKTETVEELNNQANTLKGDVKSLERATKSLEKNVKEHEQKLEDYRNEPDKYDNKGQLKDVTPELRQQRINGRIKALEAQIKKNKGELDKARKQLEQKQKELQKINQQLQKIL